MRMRSLMTQAPSRNLSSVLKRPLDQHHFGCINLGQSVLVPYQLSACSYATDRGTLSCKMHTANTFTRVDTQGSPVLLRHELRRVVLQEFHLSDQLLQQGHVAVLVQLHLQRHLSLASSQQQKRTEALSGLKSHG